MEKSLRKGLIKVVFHRDQSWVLYCFFYTLTVCNCSELVSILLFPVDTHILFIHTYLKKVNEIIEIEMNKITDWLNANTLFINAGKTKFILFR